MSIFFDLFQVKNFLAFVVHLEQVGALVVKRHTLSFLHLFLENYFTGQLQEMAIRGLRSAFNLKTKRNY